MPAVDVLKHIYIKTRFAMHPDIFFIYVDSAYMYIYIYITLMSDRARADNFQISKAIALWNCLDNLPAVPGCIRLLESSS